MDFELFRKLIRDSAPSEDALRKRGILSEDVEQFILAFTVFPREKKIESIDQSNVLGKFFSLYDASKLEIGMVRFHALPEILSSGWVFGQVEADPLVLDRATGKIYVDDLTSPGHVLWNCAESSEHFLLALIPAARYLGKCISSNSIANDKVLSSQAVEECASIAGGENFIDFYRMLLGLY